MRSRLVPPITAAAIAMIVVSNYCVVHILLQEHAGELQPFIRVWPVLLTSTVAIVLVMSTLYRTLQAVLQELEEREFEARKFGITDALTSLANRHLLEQNLEHALVELDRDRKPFALLLLDLDRFKQVNDLYGHPTGDKLLQIVAMRLHALVRETDTLARIGGDEFVILQRGIKSTRDVRKLCERITAALNEPIAIGSRHASVGTSIGALVARGTALEPAEYIRRADIALYRAKESGRNRVAFYSSSLDEEMQRRARIEYDLAAQLPTGDQIRVGYQAQVDRGGNAVAAEALVRWTHPELGLLPANEVIDIAVESGLIHDLGKLVFRKACITARSRPELNFAVNFSPVQLTPDLPAELAAICIEEGIECEQMELEVTEALFQNGGTACEQVIDALRGHGFRIAVDDFGAGYSSLSYLGRFELDKVKLDKGFSSREDSRESIAIMRAAVTLAHALGLQVIAEGIETEGQQQIALLTGCDGLQGYLYGNAAPIETIPAEDAARQAA